MALRELGPASLSVVQAVRARLAPGPVLVACSGGPDSMALAAAVAHLRTREHPGSDAAQSATALVVDHGLQTGSDQVASRVVQRLEELGLAASSTRVEVDPDSPAGIEAAARSSRYRALRDASQGCDIFLGHTMDDQAETVLLGLARGSGTRSLAGMAARRGQLVRPLLAISAETTRRACQEWQLETWQDPHNQDDRFLRVRVRYELLPELREVLGPGVIEALARTALIARDDADLLDELADAARARTERDDGRELDAVQLATLPPALRARVIRQWAVRQGAPEVRWQLVHRVLQLVEDWHGQKGIDLGAGLSVRRVQDRLLVSGSAQPPELG